MKYIIRIQAVARGFLCRRQYMRELREMLVASGEIDLLLTNEEINIRDKGRIIFKHLWAYTQMKKEQRRRLAATIKI